MACVIEIGSSWGRWAKSRSTDEIDTIHSRLIQLREGFGKPHLHAGLGIRRLSRHAFEFRASKDLRVVFLLVKPNILRLQMCGNHDDIRSWLKENT